MLAEKASAVAAYGGGGTAVYFGLTPGEWQAIGVLAGILIGVLGLLVNVYFKAKHLEIARQQAHANQEE